MVEDRQPRLTGRKQRLLESLGPQGVAVYLRDARLHLSLLPPGSVREPGDEKPAPPDIIRGAGVLASSNPRRPVLVGRRPAGEARGGGAPALPFFSTLPQTIVCSLRRNRIKCLLQRSAISYQL